MYLGVNLFVFVSACTKSQITENTSSHVLLWAIVPSVLNKTGCNMAQKIGKNQGNNASCI
jgi:hypothetical protein